jgi:hypothetical protein
VVGVITVAVGTAFRASGSENARPRLVVFRLRDAHLPAGGGARIDFPAQARKMMIRIGATGRTYLIESRAGRSFYRLTNPNGQTCFGSGPRGKHLVDKHRLGFAACSAEFPSSHLPVLDLSVYDWRRNGDTHAYRIEGIAVDEVAAIEFLDAKGTKVISVPVVDNIYRAAHPPKAAFSRIVAADAGGRAVWTEPLSP